VLQFSKWQDLSKLIHQVMGEIETFKVGARFRETVGFYATDSVEGDVEHLELAEVYGESYVNIRHLHGPVVG
jgi:hypothetical protein